MKLDITSVAEDIGDTSFGKFVANQPKIRELAIADPKSYAAVVVKAVDHFVKGSEMLEEYSDEMPPPVRYEPILKEFADSVRASKTFVIWSPEVQDKVLSMALVVIGRESKRSSEVDRNARICHGLVLINKFNPDHIREAIGFNDTSRKKYPTEIFFWTISFYLFTFADDLEAGLKATDEACKLFPNNANILNARATMLRLIAETGGVDFVNWSKQKKQAEDAKQAYKDFLKISPKDHKYFADNNYIIAYLALKYATPSSEIMLDDLRETSVYYQNGLKAEGDILPCFLPYTTNAKKVVEANIEIQPEIKLSVDIDSPIARVILGHGFTHLQDEVYIPIRKPTQRRVDVCVEHRRRLKSMLSNPTVASLVQLTVDDDDNTMATNNHCDSYEELILYQMTMGNVSRTFTSKMIQLTMVEDLLCRSSSLETVVADTSGDVIKLQVNWGTERPDNNCLKGLIHRFRFGTVWKLLNPDFHMDNGDKSTMFFRATPECLVPVSDGPKCRLCFKSLDPGQKCSKCRLAIYCGQDCQRLDWQNLKHKLICSKAYTNVYK